MKGEYILTCVHEIGLLPKDVRCTSVGDKTRFDPLGIEHA